MDSIDAAALYFSIKQFFYEFIPKKKTKKKTNRKLIFPNLFSEAETNK